MICVRLAAALDSAPMVRSSPTVVTPSAENWSDSGARTELGASGCTSAWAADVGSTPNPSTQALPATAAVRSQRRCLIVPPKESASVDAFRLHTGGHHDIQRYRCLWHAHTG